MFSKTGTIEHLLASLYIASFGSVNLPPKSIEYFVFATADCQCPFACPISFHLASVVLFVLYCNSCSASTLKNCNITNMLSQYDYQLIYFIGITINIPFKVNCGALSCHHNRRFIHQPSSLKTKKSGEDALLFVHNSSKEHLFISQDLHDLPSELWTYVNKITKVGNKFLYCTN